MASNPKSHRSTSIAIWGAVLVLVSVGIFAIRSLTRERVVVHSAQATYQDLTKTLTTNGKAEPVVDFQYRALAAGQVREIYVDPLQKVKAGQLLLKLDDTAALATLAHARATLQAAELAAGNIEHGGTQEERSTTAADLSRATLQRQQDESDLAARQKLLQQGAESPAEVAAAQHRIQVDDNTIRTIQTRSTDRFGQPDVASAQAQVADARAGVAAAQSAYADAVIRTPIAGTVYYLPVSQYDYVAAGDDLVYVADLQHMHVTAYFDEPDVGALANGQPVTITWEAKPGTVWHGHISQAPTTITSYGNTRNVGECFITVDDADGNLQPNATVNVTVTIAQHAHVLAVPREALRFDGPQPFVFRIIDRKLVRTNVQISGGIVNLTQAEIVSGLAEGDTVALNATTNSDLSDGMAVTAIP